MVVRKSRKSRKRPSKRPRKSVKRSKKKSVKRSKKKSRRKRSKKKSVKRSKKKSRKKRSKKKSVKRSKKKSRKSRKKRSKKKSVKSRKKRSKKKSVKRKSTKKKSRKKRSKKKSSKRKSTRKKSRKRSVDPLPVEEWLDLAEEKDYFLKFSELHVGKTYHVYVALDQGYLDYQIYKIISKDIYSDKVETDDGTVFGRNYTGLAVTGGGSDRAMLISNFNKMPPRLDDGL